MGETHELRGLKSKAQSSLVSRPWAVCLAPSPTAYPMFPMSSFRASAGQCSHSDKMTPWQRVQQRVSHYSSGPGTQVLRHIPASPRWHRPLASRPSVTSISPQPPGLSILGRRATLLLLFGSLALKSSTQILLLSSNSTKHFCDFW